MPATKPEPGYWLATITAENVSTLRELNFPFYALDQRWAKTVEQIAIGDRLLLYESKRGVIGDFEITDRPYPSNKRVFRSPRLFPLRIPLAAKCLSLTEPLSLAPLAVSLQFMGQTKKHRLVLANDTEKVEQTGLPHDLEQIKAGLLVALQKR